MCLYSADGLKNTRGRMSGGDHPNRRRGKAASLGRHGDSPCPETLEPKPAGAELATRASSGSTDAMARQLRGCKSDRACPGHGAAGVGAVKGSPENQASNVLKLKARRLLLGPRRPLPRR